jgi:hypothetical protein
MTLKMMILLCKTLIACTKTLCIAILRDEDIGRDLKNAFEKLDQFNDHLDL